MSPRAAARRLSARLPSLVGLLVLILAMVPGAQAQVSTTATEVSLGEHGTQEGDPG